MIKMGLVIFTLGICMPIQTTIWFAVYPHCLSSFCVYPELFNDEHNMLFPGPSQEERLSVNLANVLEKHKNELQDLGYVPCDIGVHSIRKGAGTYASSGTSAAPSLVAVNN
jgi:hypothetical protein